MKKINQLLMLLIAVTTLNCTSRVNVAVEVSFPKVDNEPLNTLPANAIVLYENWQMKESVLTADTGDKISLPGYTPDNWYPTTVPTTVLGALVRNGVYPDPYIGMNNMQIPDMSDEFNERYNLLQYSHLPDKSNPFSKPYWFRKQFEIPEEYNGKTVWLNLDGINYRADVWVNGQQVVSADDVVGIFERFRLNITEFAKPGETNAVAISIHPLDYPGDPLYAQIEGLNGNLGPNGGDAEILRNVTQYSTIGWDWVPAARDRNIGIWQHVSINSSGSVTVSDPAAFTRLNFESDTSAHLKVRFFVQNESTSEQKVELNIAIEPDGFSGEKIKIETEVPIKAKNRQEVILTEKEFPELTMKNPKLWWPVNYGEQPLYKLSVDAKLNNQTSSRAECKFGVRELSSFILPSEGRAFAVNGKTIRIAGGAWINDFLLSWSAQRYRDEVRLMAEGNATLVRINGCGIMPPDVFFDACDQYGLLVWEDFSRTSVNPEFRKDGLISRNPPACDSTIYMNNMIDVISRIRGRASLLLYCGSNEDAPQENTGKVLQNEILPEMDGTRIFIPSSSEQPEWSNIDVKTYTGGPWHMIDLPDYYDLYENAPTYENKNEIGLTSVQTINAVAESNPDFNVPDPDEFPLNKSMGYHDATGKWTMGSYLELMKTNIGKPSSIAELLKWGDLYNNQVYRTIFEAANKARPRNEGTTLWKTNAAWPSFNWQIFDWSLRANTGYYTMKSALKPLHIQFSHPDAGLQVVSTLNKNKDVRVKVSVLSAAGDKSAEKEFTAHIPVNQTVYIASLKDLIDEENLWFVDMDLMDETGKILDRTVTWTHAKINWQQLLSLPVNDISCTDISKKIIGDETEFTVKLQNKSQFPVVNVMLELTNGVFGKEILPSFWDDNALTMMPGEEKTISVKVRNNLINASPCILAEGLNINPVSWEPETGQAQAFELKITDLKIMNEGKKNYLYFTSSQSKNIGNRITTFPVKFIIDDEMIRNVSVAIKHGMDLNGRIELMQLAPGKHKFQMGDFVKFIEF